MSIILGNHQLRFKNFNYGQFVADRIFYENGRDFVAARLKG